MAKKRPSAQKRQREYMKRQRDLDKAEKAAQKRQRRLNGEDAEGAAPTGDAQNAIPSEDETPVAGE